MVQILKPITYKVLPIRAALRLEKLAASLVSGAAYGISSSETTDARWGKRRISHAWDSGYEQLAFKEGLESVRQKFDPELFSFVCRAALNSSDLVPPMRLQA